MSASFFFKDFITVNVLTPNTFDKSNKRFGTLGSMNNCHLLWPLSRRFLSCLGISPGRDSNGMKRCGVTPSPSSLPSQSKWCPILEFLQDCAPAAGRCPIPASSLSSQSLWDHAPTTSGCPILASSPPPPSFCGIMHLLPVGAWSSPARSKEGYGGAGDRVLAEGCWQSTEGHPLPWLWPEYRYVLQRYIPKKFR